ncbi:MAG: hypothetical protein AAB443_01635 [Patescibacteria group bacterium]
MPKISFGTIVTLLFWGLVLGGVLLLNPGLLGFSPFLENFAWIMRDNLLPQNFSSARAFQDTAQFARDAKPAVETIGELLRTSGLWTLLAAALLFLNRGGVINWLKGLLSGGVKSVVTPHNWAAFLMLAGLAILGSIIWTQGWETTLLNSPGSIAVVAVLGILFAVKDRLIQGGLDILEALLKFTLWVVSILFGLGFLIGPEAVLGIAAPIPVIGPVAQQAIWLGAAAGLESTSLTGVILRIAAGLILLGVVFGLLHKPSQPKAKKEGGGEKGGRDSDKKHEGDKKK